MANSSIKRFKQAWLKRKCKTDSRLSEINTSLKFQITMLSSEQQNNMIENLNMTSKNMAWSYSTILINTQSDLGPKGFTKYSTELTNIARTQSVFRLSENWDMLKYNSRRHVNELDALTTVQVMARKAYNQQEGTKF